MFKKINFESGEITFDVKTSPVSLQTKKKEKKREFQKEVHKVTSISKYVITGPCWIEIDYFSNQIKRFKNPSVYDIDNIVKPILDSFTGLDGLLIDDMIVERVAVNWIDTQLDDYLKVTIKYPDLLYSKKNELIIVKSDSNWCLPIPKDLVSTKEGKALIKNFFDVWNQVVSEDQYNKYKYALPSQNFLYYSKINNKGFKMISLNKL